MSVRKHVVSTGKEAHWVDKSRLHARIFRSFSPLRTPVELQLLNYYDIYDLITDMASDGILGFYMLYSHKYKDIGVILLVNSELN
jgi:hypothetical protein